MQILTHTLYWYKSANADTLRKKGHVSAAQDLHAMRMAFLGCARTSMANGAAFQKKWWLLCAHKLVLINGDLSSGTHFTAALLLTLLLLYCLATASGLELAIEDAVDMKDVRDVREVRHVAAAGRYSIYLLYW